MQVWAIQLLALTIPWCLAGTRSILPQKMVKRGGLGVVGVVGSLSPHSFSHFIIHQKVSTLFHSFFTSPHFSTFFIFIFSPNKLSSSPHLFFHLINHLFLHLFVSFFFSFIGVVVGRVLRFWFIGYNHSVVI